MTQNDKLLAELAEIKAMLKKAQKRVDIQWVYSLGFGIMMGSLALVGIKAEAWEILTAFFAGLILMIAAPYIGPK